MSEEALTRLIVKNLPPYVNDKRFGEFFADIGQVTDATIRRNPNGKSRKFGFIGFKTHEMARKAKEKFNNAFFDTCRLSIDFAKPIGDETLEETYARRRKRESVDERGNVVTHERRDPLEDDPDYLEYLAAAKQRDQRPSWNDFPMDFNVAPVEASKTDDSDDLDDEDEDNDEKHHEGEKNEGEDEPEDEKEETTATNRIYATNIPYNTTADELTKAFSEFGEVLDVSIPIKKITKNPAGYAFINFADRSGVEAALKTPVIFQGRHLKLHLARPQPEQKQNTIPDDDESFKDKKERQRRVNKPDSWNALFLNPDTVAEAIAHRLGFSKSEVLNPHTDGIATRLALAEAQLTKETREMFEKAGINTAAFDSSNNRLSHTLLIAKNLKYEVTEDELRALFAAYGSLVRFILAPTHATALIEYAKTEDAKKAYQALMFRKVRDEPMLLQWAPEGAVGSATDEPRERRALKPVPELKTTTLILKNVPFQATKAEIHDLCKSFGRIKSVRMPKKNDGTGHRGFCFLDFNTRQEATAAYENLRDVHLYGRHLIVQPAAEGRSVENLVNITAPATEQPPPPTSRVSH